MTGGTDWLGPIGILLSGVILGFMFLYASMRRKSAGSSSEHADLERLDLEARRDALVQQLRELDDQGVAAGDPRRAALERETADVLRVIDGRGAQPSSAAGASMVATSQAVRSGFFERRPELKGFLWGVVSVVALGVLGFTVYQSTHERGEGEGLTGGGPAGPPAGPAQRATDPAVQQLEAAVRQNPDDIEARINLARIYLERENMMGVFEQTRAVLEKHPGEPRAQAYHAIVRMAMGQLDEAESLLRSSTKTDPSLLDAWVALAWVGVQKGKRDEARVAIDSAIRNAPQNRAQLEQVWSEMAARPAAPASSEANPHAGDGAASPAVASSPLAGTGGVEVVVQLDPAASTKNGVLFVIARGEGQTSGPPIAVKRVTGSFPATIHLTTADSMMGQPLPQKVSIEVRLDPDGDASTKSPSDPRGYVPSASLGARVSVTVK